MKKLKHFLAALTAMLIVFALPLAACQPEEPEPDNPPQTTVTTELLGIELDTTNARTEFYVGQNFTYNGIKVTATTKRSDRDSSQTSDVTSSARVDSTAFRNRVGEYDISVSYTLGSTTKTETYTVTVCELTLNLDLSGVTKGIEGELPFLVGEDFSSTGLKAYATTTRPNADPETADVTSSVTVDSSAYDKSAAGTYPITVNYVGAVARSESYSVTVSAPKEGLNVTLAEGVSDTIELSADHPTASITPNIVVRSVDSYGNVITGDGGLVSSSDYTVKVYNKNQEIDVNQLSNVGEGTYQIWAYKDSSVEGYKLAGFATIFVVDSVVGIEFTEGETTQNIGPNVIGSTWKFRATYATGKTEILTASDVSFTLNTMSLANNGRNAKVTYNYVNAKGETTKLETTVTYRVVQEEGTQIIKNSYDFNAFPAEYASENTKALTQADFTGVNSFLTVVTGGTVNYRGGSNNVLEIRFNALQVTFAGIGTLTVSARSTGNTNVSVIGLKDAAGNYISGSYSSANVATQIYEEGEMYSVTGGMSEITFEITAPGTYTIFTVDNNPEGSATFNRNTRIGAIDKTDIITGASAASLDGEKV